MFLFCFFESFNHFSNIWTECMWLFVATGLLWMALYYICFSSYFPTFIPLMTLSLGLRNYETCVRMSTVFPLISGVFHSLNISGNIRSKDATIHFLRPYQSYGKLGSEMTWRTHLGCTPVIRWQVGSRCTVQMTEFHFPWEPFFPVHSAVSQQVLRSPSTIGSMFCCHIALAL